MAGTTMTIGKRIGLGFFITLVLTLIVGGTGYWGLNRVSSALQLYQETSAILIDFKTIQKDFTQYILFSYDEGRKDQADALNRLKQSLKNISRNMEGLKGNLVEMGGDQTKLESMKAGFKAYEDAVNSFDDVEKKKVSLEKTTADVYTSLIGFIKQGAINIDKMDNLCQRAEAVRIGYLNRNIEQRWDKLASDIKELGATIETWLDFVSRSDSLRPIADGVKANFAKYKDLVDQYHNLVVEQVGLSEKMNSALNGISASVQVLGEDADKMTQRSKALSLSIIMWIVGASVLTGIIYAFMSVRKIAGVLRKTIDGITNSSEEVSHASGQISSVSNMLADSASNQVVIIDEVASSLKETVSATERNSEYAREANQLIGTTEKIIEKANVAMSQLTTSMGEISSASDQTSKIIQDIDSIAFQTNLLALNAAVEAARAGDAGAGFAVVAEEVRNLAMRSAQAAKNTAYLIDGTIGKVKTGNGMVVETNKAFKEISESASKLGKMLVEIAALSTDQVEQIQKINTSIKDVDDIAQQNAATAEESASASKELNTQALNLNNLVVDMEALITSRRRDQTDVEFEGDEEESDPLPAMPPRRQFGIKKQKLLS